MFHAISAEHELFTALKLSDVVFNPLNIKVKMPTIVDILMLNDDNGWHFNICDQDKFHVQVSFINSGPGSILFFSTIAMYVPFQFFLVDKKESI